MGFSTGFRCANPRSHGTANVFSKGDTRFHSKEGPVTASAGVVSCFWAYHKVGFFPGRRSFICSSDLHFDDSSKMPPISKENWQNTRPSDRTDTGRGSAANEWKTTRIPVAKLTDARPLPMREQHRAAHRN